MEKQSACTFSVQCKDEVHPLHGCLPSFFWKVTAYTFFVQCKDEVDSLIRKKKMKLVHCMAVYLAFFCIISLMWKVTFRGGKFWANSTSPCWLRIFSLALGPDWPKSLLVILRLQPGNVTSNAVLAWVTYGWTWVLVFQTIIFCLRWKKVTRPMLDQI